MVTPIRDVCWKRQSLVFILRCSQIIRIMDTHYPSKFNWKVQKEQSYAPVSISHRSGQDQASEREQAARAARRECGGSGDPGDMRRGGRGRGWRPASRRESLRRRELTHGTMNAASLLQIRHKININNMQHDTLTTICLQILQIENDI